MCSTRIRCGPGSGTLKVKLPLASVLVRPASVMPCVRFSRTTSSPTEGLLTVLLVTVPVSDAACAMSEPVSRSNAARAGENDRKGFISTVDSKWWMDWEPGLGEVPRQKLSPEWRFCAEESESLCAAKRINLCQHFGGFVFKRGALCGIVLFRIFACAILEVEIAEVFVDHFAPLLEKIEPRLFDLRFNMALGPEDISEDGEEQNSAGDGAHRRGSPWNSSVSWR